MPGSPLNPLAAAASNCCTEGAQLVRDAADVITRSEIPIEKNPEHNLLSDQKLMADQNPARDSARRLDKDYEMLLDALGFEPASIDDLVDRTGLITRSSPP